MKIYKTSVYPSRHELYLQFKEFVNPGFADKVKADPKLNTVEKEDGIEIGIPALYETYLYKIDVKGTEVRISKSEHYTDDVNSLALEDVITAIIKDYIGEGNITAVVPSTDFMP